MSDPYDLERFLNAQQPAYSDVVAELSAGRKTSHWIWYIFPQIAGLGSSQTSQHFAISNLDEAKAYLEHPVLGPRLRECTRLVLDANERSIKDIFGYPDYLKFCSSMTLFLRASDGEEIFLDALETFFNGEQDPLTGVEPNIE